MNIATNHAQVTAAAALVGKWNLDIETLRAYGARGYGDAVACCAAQLQSALTESGAAWVTVEEAHARTGASIETIRRAVRNGEITDPRTNARGRMRIRESDLPFLAGKARRQPPTRAAASNAVAALAAL